MSTIHRTRDLSASRAGRTFVSQLGLVIVAASLFALMARYADAARRTVVGKPVVTGTDSATTLTGSRIPLLAPDSLTFLVLLDASCDACRIHARSYPGWAERRQREGTAVRVLVTNDYASTRQYARLARDTMAVNVAARELFERLKVDRVPSVALVDRKGVVRAFWAEWPGEVRVSRAGAARRPRT